MTWREGIPVNSACRDITVIRLRPLQITRLGSMTQCAVLQVTTVQQALRPNMSSRVHQELTTTLGNWKQLLSAHHVILASSAQALV